MDTFCCDQVVFHRHVLRLDIVHFLCQGPDDLSVDPIVHLGVNRVKLLLGMHKLRSALAATVITHISALALNFVNAVVIQDK